MPWAIEYADEFADWLETVTVSEQRRIDAAVELLEERGPALGRPLADTVTTSRHPNLKELRPTPTIRIFFAFDPRRVGVLLIGGDKRGDRRFYERLVLLADSLYVRHLEALGPKEAG